MEEGWKELQKKGRKELQKKGRKEGSIESEERKNK